MQLDPLADISTNTTSSDRHSVRRSVYRILKIDALNGLFSLIGITVRSVVGSQGRILDAHGVGWYYMKEWKEIHQNIPSMMKTAHNAARVAASKFDSLFPLIISSIGSHDFTISEKKACLQLCMPVLDGLQKHATTHVKELLRLHQQVTNFKSGIETKCQESYGSTKSNFDNRTAERFALQKELESLSQAGYLRQTWRRLVSGKTLEMQQAEYNEKQKVLDELKQKCSETGIETDRLDKSLKILTSIDTLFNSLLKNTSDLQQFWRLIMVDTEALKNALEDLEATRDQLLFNRAVDRIEALCKDLRLDLEPFSTSSYLSRRSIIEFIFILASIFLVLHTQLLYRKI